MYSHQHNHVSNKNILQNNRRSVVVVILVAAPFFESLPEARHKGRLLFLTVTLIKTRKLRIRNLSNLP